MPAQTRAAGQPQAAKVYKATVPEPKQQHFPSRRRHIKTYGRRTAPKRLDQTLTQMHFVSATAPEEPQVLSSSSSSSDDEEVEKAKLAKKAIEKKPTQKASRASRRKTMGDAEAEDEDEREKPRASKRRKTLGDPPSASSSFHTQTLTQLLSTSNRDEDDWKIPDSDGEDGLGSGLVKETPKKQKQKKDLGGNKAQSVKPVSVTPANRKTKLEIPSSQSPATPLLLRYSPAKELSPLKDKSANISATQSMRKSASKTPRHFVIQDSYSTSHSSPITPTPKAKMNATAQGTVTPAKRLRFDLPGNKENITPGRTKPKSPKPAASRTSQRQPLSEVPDSDDDDFEAETEEDVSAAATPTRVPQSGNVVDAIGVNSTVDEAENFTISVDKDADEHEHDEFDERYVAGDETQALLISSGHPSSLELGSRDISKDASYKHRSQEEQGDDEEQIVRATPTNRDAAEGIIEQTPTRSRHSKRVEDPAPLQDEVETQGYTQGMESQRVPLETIKATGPISDRSDIIISIYSEHVKNMANRTKTHEFRDWKFPETVHRVWIYIPRPISELKYMCTFGRPRVAGEIGEEGIGNVEFNRGMKRSKFAHEVIDMYELNNPVPLQTMRNNGWPTAPQKFSYVPPAVVGQLTANLRCALWGEDAEQEHVHSSPDVTESQELAEQIRSDISHATQLESSDQPEVIPSSQSPPRSLRNRKTPGKGKHFARPALPTNFSASSVRSLPATRSQANRGIIRPSQASTISQVSSSSPVVSPEKSLALPPLAGTVRSVPIQLPESSSPSANRHSHHSLRSSQFPTKSQMLPDSLLNDDIQEPPPIIWDSADEDSD